MKKHEFFRALTCAALLALCAAPAYAGDIEIGGGAAYTAHVKSWKELRDSRVVKQQYDFSCGSAAVATLLTFSYKKPTTEQEAFKAMYNTGNKAHIRQVGFSLLDMKAYLAKRGLHADGYQITIKQLRTLHFPAIALISPGGYNHFVVLRGWDGNSLIVADPNRGLRRMMAQDFADVWNGIILVVHDDLPLAGQSYNNPADLKIAPRGPGQTEMAGDQDIDSFLLHLPSIDEF